MACAALSANSCTIASSSSFCTYKKDSRLRQKQSLVRFRIRASTDDSDCNVEECAPDKEVGKVSMEWVAGDNSKVVGTFPPRKRGYTGYVEKDTAGQTNIYSVEPAVYVAESPISSGSAGTSKDGAENTAAIAAGVALISIAAASSILLQVGKNSPPPVQTMEYSGPSLTYYINKFKPAELVQASVSAPEVEVVQASVAQETEAPNAPEVEVAQASVPQETEAPNAPEVETSASETPQVEVQAEAPQDSFKLKF